MEDKHIFNFSSKSIHILGLNLSKSSMFWNLFIYNLSQHILPCDSRLNDSEMMPPTQQPTKLSWNISSHKFNNWEAKVDVKNLNASLYNSDFLLLVERTGSAGPCHY